jgi:hypothetical protein
MDPDINELEALTALLDSDGWKLFLEHVEKSHGPAASVQQIDAALQGVPRGDREAVEDTVQQIRARAKAAEALIAWPRERVTKLRAKKAGPATTGLFRRRTG